MTNVSVLQDLRADVNNFDKMDLREMQKFVTSFREQVEDIFEDLDVSSAIFKSYLDYILVSHIQHLDSFIRKLHDLEEDEAKFLKKVIRYHCTSIIDSFTYACIALHHDEAHHDGKAAG